MLLYLIGTNQIDVLFYLNFEHHFLLFEMKQTDCCIFHFISFSCVSHAGCVQYRSQVLPFYITIQVVTNVTLQITLSIAKPKRIQDYIVLYWIIETILMSVVIELIPFYECCVWIDRIHMIVVFEWDFETANGECCKLLCTGCFKSVSTGLHFQGHSMSRRVYECGPSFLCYELEYFKLKNVLCRTKLHSSNGLFLITGSYTYLQYKRIWHSSSSVVPTLQLYTISFM
jgi:hypothetical protein